jgi:ADP-ribosyl-[dinitrogen reductase] hydrolase
MYKDKIAGALIGLAVGDALGVPHEFKTQRHNVYTGLLYLVPEFHFRCGTRKDVIGQYSDDSECTLSNLRSIIANRGYSREDVILEYLEWARDSKAMGKNTRALLKGVKTIKGYQTRWDKIFGNSQQEEWTQSNGSLMRCSMLAFLPDYMNATFSDCTITNPHKINTDSNLAYCMILRYTAKGVSKNHIIDIILRTYDQINICDEVKTVIREAISSKDFSRNVKAIGKGWVLHAFYSAVWGWYHFDSYQEAIDIIIRQGGDTDTNAAIAGALIGSNLGYERMMQEDRTRYNIETVRKADFRQGQNPRPPKYLLSDFDSLVADYANLVGDQMI